jgi:predicted transcriptional regulator
MTLTDIIRTLGLRVLNPNAISDTEVTGGYVCDLLSDVMANARPGNLWITLQIHQNILAVARIKDLAGIIIVNGRQPDDETVQKAEEERLPLLVTEEPAFGITGRLHRLLERP